MNIFEYLKARGRMTNNCEDCTPCLLGKEQNKYYVKCTDLEHKYPQLAIEIVEKWAKENPVKTYLSVLLEKFPNAMLIHSDSDDEELIPTFCPKDAFNTKEREDGECPTFKCCDCWKREYKEE